MKKIKQFLINLPNESKLAEFTLNILNKFRKEKIVENRAFDAKNVFDLINLLSVRVYPFFGTLLSIHRDDAIIFADDYDFATTDKYIFTKEFIEEVESYGAKLVAFSVVGDELVEISFKLNGTKIDFFYLKKDDKYTYHYCPNFRKERARKELSNLEINNFKTSFIVKYYNYDLVYNDKWKVYCPSEPEKIFEKHYGTDWNIPKTSNFIDYNNYKFIEIPSFTAIGDEKNLKHKLQEYV
ncbi:TPA: hypothetical protein ACX6SY_003230 [Photobacterium damselae]